MYKNNGYRWEINWQKELKNFGSGNVTVLGDMFGHTVSFTSYILPYASPLTFEAALTSGREYPYHTLHRTLPCQVTANLTKMQSRANSLITPL